MIWCLMSKNSILGGFVKQGGQVLCNHAIVFRVLLHTDCVIYIFSKFLAQDNDFPAF